MIKLVAFLGNYGREYEKTRHNVAWFFEDSLPFANRLNWQNKFKGEISSCTPQELAQWACDTKICSKKDGSPVLVPEEAPAHAGRSDGERGGDPLWRAAGRSRACRRG